ncbi:NUDIX domain-containing protein [Modestobacter sp. I12A-02628]|uniref:NUDIX hydrolase n=1 Tax=Goekera deserti TaxID=2497753 RepID=A0A7K3WC55_9ACTN|nr:NUDIX hydrolase [Goekera deserti]MPQ98808.1 NUDIX domain-containing protein [Goekera deserti]NDI49694.1 NUDIX domain-containing protein [Goekera deserti]NEL53113.1 NUDIX hydrolase [Goekera deserti]
MRTTSSREVYRNPWIRVREDVVERADGSTGLYGVVEKPHFALVLPAERDGFWLVEQFRYALGRRSWEFPQGTWPQGSGGTPEDLARAELAEETGLRAGTLRHLGHLDQSPGLSTQEFDVWLATDLVPGPTAREESEADMVSAFVTEEQLRLMVREGRFTDGPSLAALSLLLLER